PAIGRLLEAVLLGEVAHAQAAAHGHGAGVGALQSGEDPQERGLARPVGSDEPRALALEEPQRQPLEERARAEALGEILTAEEDPHRVYDGPTAHGIEFRSPFLETARD